MSSNIALITHLTGARDVFARALAAVLGFLACAASNFVDRPRVISILRNALYGGGGDFFLLFNDLSYYCNLLTSATLALTSRAFLLFLLLIPFLLFFLLPHTLRNTFVPMRALVCARPQI